MKLKPSSAAQAGKPIWQLAAINNRKPLVVRKRNVTLEELRLRPYHGLL